MEKSVVFDRIPDSFKTKVLGEGSNSICYLTSDSLAYKEYLSIAPNHNMLARISEFQTDKFIFPYSFVYLDSVCYDNFKGYLMEYFDGDRITFIDGNINIHTLINELKGLEEDIKYLSKNKVMLEDINSTNILVNKSGVIKVVDPDYYWISGYMKDTDQIRRINLSTSSHYLVSPILNCYNLSFVNDRLLALRRACFLGNEYVSNLLTEIISELEQNNISINTVSDLQDNVSVLKRVKLNE